MVFGRANKSYLDLPSHSKGLSWSQFDLLCVQAETKRHGNLCPSSTATRVTYIRVLGRCTQLWNAGLVKPLDPIIGPAGMDKTQGKKMLLTEFQGA